MRQYEKIWHTLKNLPQYDASLKGVSISAPRAFHKRIIKAVIKEKWMDIEYKLLHEPRVITLAHSKKNSILTFYLIFNILPEDL